MPLGLSFKILIIHATNKSFEMATKYKYKPTYNETISVIVCNFVLNIFGFYDNSSC